MLPGMPNRLGVFLPVPVSTDRYIQTCRTPKVYIRNQGSMVKVLANGAGREFGKPLVRARITQCPRRARWPASPAASHAHTTLLGASGARRRGSLDCAPWSLRASSTRPRATAAAATRAPRGVWASCMRTTTECTPPPLERHSGAACPPQSAGVRVGEGL